MTPGLTTVIIPTIGEPTLQAAVESAQAQGNVEVLVIDGSSGGPARARNEGLERAAGEFIQFLDADDTLEPGKLAAQIAALDAEHGWCVCDTRIIEVNGREQLASERYDYGGTRLIDGWIAPLLAVGNFIPVHAPLYRREAIGGVRFPERALEDWHFVHDVAQRARVTYAPIVGCTYRKRAGSRNAGTRRDPATSPGVVPPLRLNLGCGKPGHLDWHPLPGMVNLDKGLGWRFEDGLGDFADGSVAGITVSHAMMYVDEADWPTVCREFARVLAPGGIVRITEDDCEHPDSIRYRSLWQGSESGVTMTGPAMARRHLEAAGFAVRDVAADETQFADRSLIQAQHRPAPDCFWIEGIRQDAVLFEPHADDAALFAAFSMLRYRPRVVTCFPSAGDYGDTAVRHAESCAAAAVLGAGPVEQWDIHNELGSIGGHDINALVARRQTLVARMRALDGQIRPARVFAPSPDASHPDHVAVALAAREVFGDRLTEYQTYNAAGKVREGDPAPFEPGWQHLKRRALACFETQLAHPRARDFFLWPIDEWLDV